jgi:hypothetical protein
MAWQTSTALRHVEGTAVAQYRWCCVLGEHASARSQSASWARSPKLNMHDDEIGDKSPSVPRPTGGDISSNKAGSHV